MSKTRFVLSITVVALLVATPAMGQLRNSPTLALAPGDADGATSIGAGWGRGLNDNSGKLNSFILGGVRSMEKVSFAVLGGYVLDKLPDVDEITVGGHVAYNALNDPDQPVSVGIQGGIEWMSVDGTPDNTTLLNFPVGVSISGSTEAGSMAVRPWVMPRVQFTRSSGGGTASSTETDFGASAGVSARSEGGVGIALSVDWLYTDDGTGSNNVSQLLFGASVFYRLP